MCVSLTTSKLGDYVAVTSGHSQKSLAKGGGGGAITFSLGFARTPALLKQRSEAPWVAAGSLPQLCIFPAGSVLID